VIINFYFLHLKLKFFPEMFSFAFAKMFNFIPLIEIYALSHTIKKKYEAVDS